MPEQMLTALTDELMQWRANLVGMRSANVDEVDAVIGHIDETIKVVADLRAADVVDSVVR